MKRRVLASLLAILGVCSLASCSSNKHYECEDYILEMNYKENFKILQLTDIHFSNKDDLDRHYAFMDLTIKDANPDLIVVTGDLFTFADKATVRNLFDYFDSKNTPWTVTFGNHDEQGYFSIGWLTDYLNDLNDDSNSNCIFKDIFDDDVFGNANFVINLVDGTTVKEQLFILDSNRYNYGGYFGYDFIKDSQIEWYKRIVDYSTNTYSNGTDPIESVAFFHIPFPEYVNAWDEAPKNVSKDVQGEKREDSCIPDFNSGFFDTLVDKKSTKAVFVGHDHNNDYAVEYKGILLSYGVKSTDRVYFEPDMMGGQTITFTSTGLKIDRIFHTYEEVE